MAKDDRIQKGILGDIRPTPPSRPATPSRPKEKIVGNQPERDEPMQGGWRRDESDDDIDIIDRPE